MKAATDGRSRLSGQLQTVVWLIELPFDASDEPSVGTGEGDDPFWWLEPEADYSERGTALVPVLVR